MEESCGRDNRAVNPGVVEIQMKITEKMGAIKHKVVVISNKGGVGKTTVAVNLAVALARDGFDVGILDADLHGPNVPKMLGITNLKISSHGEQMNPAVFPVGSGIKVISMGFLADKDSSLVWRGPLKMSIINQFLGEVKWGSLDYLIIDLPPGTSDEPLSIGQLIPQAGAVVVTTPQEVALLDSRKAVDFARQLKMPVIGIIENMSGLICPHCSQRIDLFSFGGGEKAAQELGVPFLGRIPIDPKIVVSGDMGKPFVLEQADTTVARAFRGIIEKVRKFIDR